MRSRTFTNARLLHARIHCSLREIPATRLVCARAHSRLHARHTRASVVHCARTRVSKHTKGRRGGRKPCFLHLYEPIYSMRGCVPGLYARRIQVDQNLEGYQNFRFLSKNVHHGRPGTVLRSPRRAGEEEAPFGRRGRSRVHSKADMEKKGRYSDGPNI